MVVRFNDMNSWRYSELENLQEIRPPENREKAVHGPVGMTHLSQGCKVLCWDVGSSESRARRYNSIGEAARKEGVHQNTINSAFRNNPDSERVHSMGRMWKKAKM